MVVIPSDQSCLYRCVPQLNTHPPTHPPTYIIYAARRALRPSTATIQNLFLLLLATPALIAATHPSPSPPLTLPDLILTLTALALLAFSEIVEKKIDIPRTRDLDVTFTQGFQDIVHELRSHIVRARQ